MERDQLEDPGVDGRIMLNGSSIGWMGSIDWIWLRIGTEGKLLWMR
jgi:hypothetical protein